MRHSTRGAASALAAAAQRHARRNILALNAPLPALCAAHWRPVAPVICASLPLPLPLCRHSHAQAAMQPLEAATAEAASAEFTADPAAPAAELASPLPLSQQSFHFDSVVNSEASFASFLAAWQRKPSPLHPASVASAHRAPACVVAVSGGVDSAVTALLCLAARDAGLYSCVHAVHMRNWDEVEERGVCSGERDARDAARLCASLRLPLTEVDFSREYFLDVFRPLVDEYAAGNTPSPDVLCNRVIKFSLLMQHVQKEHGTDAVLATGHYARIQHGLWTDSAAASASSVPSDSPPEPQLFVALDPLKDQSYFLSSVPSSALRSCVFPLGFFTKKFVKETLARGEWARSRMQLNGDRSAELPWRRELQEKRVHDAHSASVTASTTAGASPAAPAFLQSLPSVSSAPTPLHALSAKKESMGICFIGKRSLASFLSQYLPLHAGVFVDIDSRRIVGRHTGWETWTVGQKAAISGCSTKLYVCGKSEAQGCREGESEGVVITPPPKAPPRRDRLGRRLPPAEPIVGPPPPYAVYVCVGRTHPALIFDDLHLDEPQWVAAQEPAELSSLEAAEDGVAERACSMRVSVKIRSSMRHVDARLWKMIHSSDAPLRPGDASPPSASLTSASNTVAASSPHARVSYRVEFASPQLSVAAGQSCVLYDASGRRCIGQGRIQRAGLSYWQRRKQPPQHMFANFKVTALEQEH